VRCRDCPRRDHLLRLPMSDLLAELAKMTGGQWAADGATLVAMGIGIVTIWQVWVIPFEARVAREMAKRAAGARHERNEV